MQNELDKLRNQNTLLKGGLAGLFLFTQRKRIFRGVGCAVVVGVCAICCLVFSVIAYINYQRELSAVRDAYGERVAGMCDPVTGGEANLANLPAGNPPLGVLALKTDDRIRHSWHDELGDWRADDAESLDMVACVQDGTAIIDTCSYDVESSGGDIRQETVNRVQKTAYVVLLNADTGLRIAENILKGDEPPPCPARYADVPTPKTEISGGDVPVNDLVSWFIFLYF